VVGRHPPVLEAAVREGGGLIPGRGRHADLAQSAQAVGGVDGVSTSLEADGLHLVLKLPRHLQS